MITMRLEGGAELARTLRALPKAVSLRAQREALRAGAEPMRRQAAAMAPRGPDAPHISDNIVTGIPRKRPIDIERGHAVIAMGPEQKFLYGYYWEYGTVKLAARPFMRPAFDTQAPNALRIIGQALGEAIVKAAVRLAKKAGLQTTRGQSTGVGI